MGSKELVMPDGVGFGDEVLNKYDEGTWVPVAKIGASSTGWVFTPSTSYYTRIGNLVHLTSTIAITTKGAGTGGLTVEGMPFPSRSGSGRYQTGTFYIDSLLAIPTGGVICYIAPGTSIINAGTSTGGVTVNDTNLQTSSTIIINITYQI